MSKPRFDSRPGRRSLPFDLYQDISVTDTGVVMVGHVIWNSLEAQ